MNTTTATETVRNRKLVLESVGMADAAALRAIRQVVPSSIQEVAKLVYQAPSELARNLRAEAADEVAALLGGLGFRVEVRNADAEVAPGSGAFEVALGIRDLDRLPELIAEAAAFLGTDAATARRVVCAAPAVLLSQVSAATVAAVRARFEPLGAEILVSELASARYYAVIASESRPLLRTLGEIVTSLAPQAETRESDGALSVSGLTVDEAKALWERLQRIGARASLCNHDLERYDVALQRAGASDAMRAVLEELGIPGRVSEKVLARLPVVVRQGVGREELARWLDRIASAGGDAVGLPHSFQRFALNWEGLPDPDAAARALVSLGDLSEAAAAAAVREPKGEGVGRFTKTTALWLQRVLQAQGARVALELLQ